uniref:Uncharacterized protein n=1 Tax=Oryza nivara TaxID=4536 RepID=A0A0E0HU66_ORYNI
MDEHPSSHTGMAEEAAPNKIPWNTNPTPIYLAPQSTHPNKRLIIIAPHPHSHIPFHVSNILEKLVQIFRDQIRSRIYPPNPNAEAASDSTEGSQPWLLRIQGNGAAEAAPYRWGTDAETGWNLEVGQSKLSSSSKHTPMKIVLPPFHNLRFCVARPTLGRKPTRIPPRTVPILHRRRRRDIGSCQSSGLQTNAARRERRGWGLAPEKRKSEAAATDQERRPS